MHPALKIVAGALMIVVGVYSSVTFFPQLLSLLQAAIGPLLIVVGAFIVWLESDEWKRMASRDSPVEEPEPEPVRQIPDHEAILEGTVDEVRSQVMEREDLNVERLLELERRGKERKTLIEFLERRV